MRVGTKCLRPMVFPRMQRIMSAKKQRALYIHIHVRVRIAIELVTKRFPSARSNQTRQR
jgi:hypothetical protein